jgi:hypothetical protein
MSKDNDKHDGGAAKVVAPPPEPAKQIGPEDCRFVVLGQRIPSPEGPGKPVKVIGANSHLVIRPTMKAGLNPVTGIVSELPGLIITTTEIVHRGVKTGDREFSVWKHPRVEDPRDPITLEQLLEAIRDHHLTKEGQILPYATYMRLREHIVTEDERRAAENKRRSREIVGKEGEAVPAHVLDALVASIQSKS